jgi:hypothetical protein
MADRGVSIERAADGMAIGRSTLQRILNGQGVCRRLMQRAERWVEAI